MKQDFDWSLVRSFLAALDCGSLLGAARALGTSQPTIGRHIAELESQLGVVLFERTGRGLLPSETAVRLADSARDMENGALQLAHKVSAAQARITGTVRLSASQTAACYLLPPILTRMQQALPDIQVELVVSNAVSNLLRREADIALRMVRPAQSTLIAKRIGKLTIGTYAQRDYLRRCGTPRQAAELLAHTLIGQVRDESIVQGFAAMGHRLGPEHFALRTDDLNAYWELVRAGAGIGFIADYVARSDNTVVAILPALRIAPIPVWLAVHREIRTNARIRAVFDYLADAVPDAL